MKLLEFDTLASTNQYLKENYAELDSFTMVSAKRQTSGRGRRNRVWDSEYGNLYCSLLIKDSKYYSKLEELSVVTAYIVLKTLEKHGLKNLSVKWPNDVYVNSKKIAGILLESVFQEVTECMIIGIGVNLNQKEFAYYKQNEPTSYYLESGEYIDVNEFRDELYQNLLTAFEEIMEGASFYHEIEEYDYLKGKKVYAQIDRKKELVEVEGIRENYTLEVKRNDKIYYLRSGEISFHL